MVKHSVYYLDYLFFITQTSIILLNIWNSIGFLAKPIKMKFVCPTDIPNHKTISLVR